MWVEAFTPTTRGTYQGGDTERLTVAVTVHAIRRLL
jgi:hypothetical protein